VIWGRLRLDAAFTNLPEDARVKPARRNAERGDMTADEMPIYPDEAMIAVAVLGPKRAKDWPSIAKFLQDKDGLPPIDKQMGGRYWPAVVLYFRQRNNMDLFDGIPRPPRMPPHLRYVPTPDKR
jgi:hypothetical protein